MWFDTCINDQRTAATPMFMRGEGIDAIDVVGWIAACIGDPNIISKGG